MTKALIRKEFRQLLPFVVAMAIFMTLNLVISPITFRLDEITWVEASGRLEPESSAKSAIILLCIGLTLAFCLFPREHDEGTISFLYSLPISRVRVFIVKLVAAQFILAGGLLLGYVVDWIVQLPNNQTFTGSHFRFGIFMKALFLDISFAFIVLSHGILLSFFRRFGLVIYGSIWWIIWTLEQLSPYFGYLNITKLLSFEYHGQTLLIPWRMLLIHSGFSVICIIAAAFLWTEASERFTLWYQNLFRAIWGRMVLAGSMVSIVALVIWGFHIVFEDRVSGHKSRPYVTPFETARFETKQCWFTYPVNLRAKAMPLIQEADAGYSDLKKILNAGPTDRLIVDLTEKSSEHAGLAAGMKIRMDIHRQKDAETYQRTFYHEVTHIFASVESNRKINEHSNTTAFFNEGLAEYLSYRLVPDKEKLDGNHLLAAASWKLHKIAFADLTDLKVFKRKYNENLIYALGEVWVMSQAQVCGDRILGDILKAMGRKEAPRDIAGVVFWQDTLQAAGCDFEKVKLYWRRYLSHIANTRKGDLDKIPRIIGGLEEADEYSLIFVGRSNKSRPRVENPFYIRIRSDADAKETEIQTYKGVIRPDTNPLEVGFAVPRDIFNKRRFEFQFGCVFQKGLPPYYEKWQSGSIP